MPLPAALAARLAKRGIVAPPPRQPTRKTATPGGDQVEEVFAEDYDDHPQEHHAPHKDSGSESDGEESEIIHNSIACPNKANPYHQCVAFCLEKWGTHKFEPKANMKKKRDRMLKKYPLPEGWIEVGDPETNRYYYWNTMTEEVSWLSPTHPRAKVSLPAEVIRRNVHGGPSAGSAGSEESESESDEDEEKEMDLDMDDEDFEKLEREIMREKQEKEDKRRGQTGGRKGRDRKEELDPMDPAAYSDIPRGSWSDGLERAGAKTGADVTASGPLFQQRPYPSPGAVLRMNKDK